MSEKKIRDPEFAGWQAMRSLERDANLWIYFSPDNLYGALVNVETGDVIFITDRVTGEKLYSHPKAKTHAKIHRARNMGGRIQPRKLP